MTLAAAIIFCSKCCSLSDWLGNVEYYWLAGCCLLVILEWFLDQMLANLASLFMCLSVGLHIVVVCASDQTQN